MNVACKGTCPGVQLHMNFNAGIKRQWCLDVLIYFVILMNPWCHLLGVVPFRGCGAISGVWCHFWGAAQMEMAKVYSHTSSRSVAKPIRTLHANKMLTYRLQAYGTIVRGPSIHYATWGRSRNGCGKMKNMQSFQTELTACSMQLAAHSS